MSPAPRFSTISLNKQQKLTLNLKLNHKHIGNGNKIMQSKDTQGRFIHRWYQINKKMVDLTESNDENCQISNEDVNMNHKGHLKHLLFGGEWFPGDPWSFVLPSRRPLVILKQQCFSLKLAWRIVRAPGDVAMCENNCAWTWKAGSPTEFPNGQELFIVNRGSFQYAEQEIAPPVHMIEIRSTTLLECDQKTRTRFDKRLSEEVRWKKRTQKSCSAKHQGDSSLSTNSNIWKKALVICS